MNDGLIDPDGDAKVLLGFLEEKLKTLMSIHFSLLWEFSDQIQNCPILLVEESERLDINLSKIWLEFQIMP